MSPEKHTSYSINSLDVNKINFQNISVNQIKSEVNEIYSEDASSMPFLSNIQKLEDITSRIKQPNGDNIELLSTRAFDINNKEQFKNVFKSSQSLNEQPKVNNRIQYNYNIGDKLYEKGIIKQKMKENFIY